MIKKEIANRLVRATEGALRKPLTKENPVNHVFVCGLCKKEFPMNEVFDHFEKEHNIKLKGIAAKKQMQAHLDGRDWFSSTYFWEFENGSTLTEFYKMERKTHPSLARV